MKIALDYDGTITESFTLWAWFVKMFRSEGHDVRIVTFRDESEVTSDMLNFIQMTQDDHGSPIPLICTGRVWKHEFCTTSANWNPGIWIDDAPALINHPDGIWDAAKIEEWRKSIEETIPDRVSKKQTSTEGSKPFTSRALRNFRGI